MRFNRLLLVAVLPFLCALLFAARILNSKAGQMTSTLLIGSSKIDVSIDAAPMKLSQAELLHWVQTAADALATYYARYPVFSRMSRFASRPTTKKDCKTRSAVFWTVAAISRMIGS